MKQVVKLLMIFISISWSLSLSGQTTENGLIGNYYSIENKFEKSAIIELKKDGTFEFKYALGGCQGEISGLWTIENKKIRFKNDLEYRNALPDLSLFLWTVKKNGIRPDGEINCGCLKPKKIFIKQ